MTEGRLRLYECRVCLETAGDPVLTVCGHLYCWPCLHGWLAAGHNDCPVCKGGVTKESVIPIYGSDGDQSEQKDPREKDIPKRPAAEHIPAPPNTTTASNGGGFANFSANFSFGLFPLGIGFAASTFTQNGVGRSLSRDEQLSQALSMGLLMFGLLLTLYILIFGAGGSSESAAGRTIRPSDFPGMSEL